MKASKYNLIMETDEKTKIAFNATTCALAEVDDNFFDVLNTIDDIRYEELEGEKKTIVDAMLEGNYIVQDELDELKLLKYRHYNGKYNNSALGLTVALTLGCNFACPYCYENAKQGFLSQEAIDGIIEMVTESAKRKKSIQMTWYGGEPMLAKDIIFDLSEKLIKICDENEVNYSAFIVTNGYLITDEIVGKFKEARIGGAQITIDGPPRIHNTRRKLKGSDKETFDTILNNVIRLKKQNLHVTIRINIDKSNVDHIEELLDILEENDLKDISISLGHVTAYTEACMSVSESCLNTEEYAESDIKYQRILHERGFNIDGYPYYPGIKANYCCADSIGSFVLDPQGYMYKCWNDVGNVERAVGDIKKVKETPADKMLMRNIDYLFWTPFDFPKCVECELLPICMGGCPFNGEKKGGEPDCEKWKYNLESVLKLTYTRKKDQPEEESDTKTCKCG